jgi:hypothetical protein
LHNNLANSTAYAILLKTFPFDYWNPSLKPNPNKIFQYLQHNYTHPTTQIDVYNLLGPL